MGKSRRDRTPQVEATDKSRISSLELAIGREVREFRKKHDMTVADLARLANLSPGMLSKIENGLTSPSLATLRSLSAALQVPVTAFFRKFEEQTEAVFVRAGGGLDIERRGTRAGHHYRLLGHSVHKNVDLEPYVVELTEASEVFPLFQHPGVEFIYILKGTIRYRHGDKTYLLKPGDSLYFDAEEPHGPEELIKLPIRFLAVMAEPRGADD